MKKIVILGNSPAVIGAIEAIRCRDVSSEIMVLGFDGYYPYDRQKFCPFIAKDIMADQVMCRPKNFFTQNKVDVVLDKKITRVNFKRQKIFTEEKVQIDYDFLVITEVPDQRCPDIKGNNKAGVFGMRKLKDVNQIVHDLPFTKTIAVQSDQCVGFQTAMAFMKAGKEVIFITSKSESPFNILDMPESQWVADCVKEEKLHMHYGQSVSEILGESDVKAIRLQSGKVLACQMVLFEAVKNNFKAFADSILDIREKIYVNSQFQTNVNHVFALADACEGGDAQNDAYAQGQVVGEAILASLSHKICDENREEKFSLSNTK